MSERVGVTARSVWLVLSIAAVCAASTVRAQEPPAYERKAVEAVVAMLQGTDDATLESFVETAMVASPDRDVAALVAKLRGVRERAKSMSESLTVEGEPDGVLLILGGAGGEAQIRVALGPEGISSLDWVESSAAGSPAPSRDLAVRLHMQAMESSMKGEAEEVLKRFESQHFSKAFMERTNERQRKQLVDAMRRGAADARSAGIEMRDGGFTLTLEGKQLHEIEFEVEQASPFLIDALAIQSREQPHSSMELTRKNMGATFDELEGEGFSGVVYVQLDGEVVLHRAFGTANAHLGSRVKLDTIFGTGSRPIDYTIVSIYLLEQQGRLRMDDTIDKYFEGVPADKRAMTIRHLMTGQSGLPDFFHTEADWNPDLAWVDRATAERRLLAQPLLFAPGTDNVHSHGAFGLLAALIERVSGKSYAAFIRENFLDPAGMTRTGFYGESKNLSVEDFAAGWGPNIVGLPNIPPNWGPTSWLVMGSGGMYSTLEDLQRFYRFVRAGNVLEERYAKRFLNFFASLDGSDRGFELFHIYNPAGHEAILMVNSPGIHPVIGALERLIAPEGISQ